MAQDVVNVGTGPNSGNGDYIRSAFQKINGDIAEIFALIAPLASTDSPSFSGVPEAPTASGSDDSTQIANMEAVQAAIALAVPGGIVGDMFKANNLSDLTNATTARTNLGVTIGTNVQAYDADLTTWGGVTRATGFDAFAATPSSDNLRALLTDDTGTGVNVFAISPAFTGTPTAPTAALNTNTTQLATMAAVKAAADAITAGAPAGLDTLVEIATALGNDASYATTTAAALALKAPLASPTLTGTPAAPTAANGTNTTQLATTAYVLATRLDQLAVPTGAVSLSSQLLSNVANPVSAQDAATKAYVDSLAQGLDPKASVKCATTANITLSGEQTLDGILTSASRVLVKSQSTPSQNGIYVSAAGSWTRALDFDLWTEVPGAFVFVEEGTTLGNTGWTCTSDAGGAIGSTTVTWVQFAGVGSYTASTGLSLTGTAFSVDSTIATLAGSQSLTNKTIAGASNTLTVLAGSQLSGQVPMANGGTGANLVDPNADRILFWDDSAGASTWLSLGATLSITGTQLDAVAGSGTSISPIDFGAVGNGSTDDTTAMQAAITAAAGRIIDLLGKNYRIDSSLSLPSNTLIQNGRIDFSNAATNDTLFECLGTLGSSTAFTAASRGATTFVVSSASGIAAKQFLYLKSTNPFGYNGTDNGEWVEVKSIASTTVTPYALLQDAYTTTPLFYKPTLVENVTLRNLVITGRGDTYGQICARFYLARNVLIENVRSEFFGDRHVYFERCIDTAVMGGAYGHSDNATGLSYGIVVANGCLRSRIVGASFRDLRHGVTIGGEVGVDRNVSVIGNTITDSTDGALDCHPQCEYVTISGNVCGNDSTTASVSGIVFQGAHGIITNNVVYGFKTSGIFVQPLVFASHLTDDTCVVSGNQVTRPFVGATTVYGIWVNNQRTVSGYTIAIQGNAINVAGITASYGVYIEADAAGSASNFSGLAIGGNIVVAGRSALSLITGTSRAMTCVAITGNTLKTTDTTTYDCVALTAGSTPNWIERVIISGNAIFGGRYGVNSNASRVKVDANMIQAFGTAATNGTLVGTSDNYTA